MLRSRTTASFSATRSSRAMAAPAHTVQFQMQSASRAMARAANPSKTRFMPQLSGPLSRGFATSSSRSVATVGAQPSANPKPIRPKSPGYFKWGLVLGLVAGVVWGAFDNGIIRLEDEATVQPPTKCEPFPTSVNINGTLFDNIGVGVRTVSFMHFHVYAVGIYVAHDDLAKARKVLRSTDDLRSKLYSESESITVIDTLLDSGVRFTVRITPVRNTDFGHLRDGFVRSIMNNPKFREIGNDEEFGVGLQELKQAFSRKLKAPKGDNIYMVQNADGSMVALYEKQNEPEKLNELGSISVPAVARIFYLQYLSGKSPNSPTARDSSMQGLLALA